MSRRPRRSTRTDTLVPDTTVFRSAVQNVMQFDAASHRMGQEVTAQKHARDGCDKGDNRDQNEQPRLHRGPASNMEGASGLDGPKGESVTEASTGDVTPLDRKSVV